MNFAAVRHIPKSPMAYAQDEETLHIYLETAKDDLQKAELIAGDPFDYIKLEGKYRWRPSSEKNLAMEKLYSGRHLDYWFLEVKAPSKRTKYAFILHAEGSRYFYGPRRISEIKEGFDLYDPFEYFNYPDIPKEDLPTFPEWAKNTVWYQIFPERFARKGPAGSHLPWDSVREGITNHHLFGGNLAGIRERLPYLADLGITGIYLTPIFEAFSAHKYDTIDYFKIDPQFGTEADFRELVRECHSLGIRIILDAVFNHCGWFHPFFQDVIKRKKASPYWDCFFIEDENFIDFPISSSGLPLVP